MFTANLKAFSERLVAKTETEKEVDTVKVEEDGTAVVEAVVENDKTLTKSIKREADDEEQKLVETKHNVVRKTKRRKKASF